MRLTYNPKAYARYSSSALRPRTDRRGDRQAGGRAARVEDRRRGRHRSGEGRSRPRRRRRVAAAAERESIRRCVEGVEEGTTGRRRAVHELVDQEGDAADRNDPEIEDADR